MLEGALENFLPKNHTFDNTSILLSGKFWKKYINSISVLLLFKFFTVVAQKYETGTSDSYIIVGNSALVKCEVPSFVTDFITLMSWVDNSNNEYYPSESLGILF